MSVTSLGFRLKGLLFCVCFIYVSIAFGSIRIASWNLENFSSRKEEWTFEVMAQSLKSFDVVAIQEVNASPSGAQGIEKLITALNKTGYKWDYCVSDITTSDNAQERERYVFVWKTSQIKLKGKAFLATKLEDQICREPYMATFQKGKTEFTLVSIHAIPKKKQPETELKFLKLMPELYPDLDLIFLGDFNCPESHTVFNPLKSKGFAPSLVGQKTTLKQQCINGDCLASIYDNIFFNTRLFNKITFGIIPFYNDIEWIKIRKVSDHVPVFVELE